MGSAGFFPAVDGPRRHQARDLLPVAGDFPLLHQVKQLAKSVLGLEGTDLAQGNPL